MVLDAEIERWDFALPDSRERLANLHKPKPFASIVEDITKTLTILCCHPDRLGNTSFQRVAYCIRIKNDLFDLFFNSSNGYRASYYRSPFEGLRANSFVIERLSSVLLDTDHTRNCQLELEFIEESLRSPSAKIWLAERGKEVSADCVGCKGEWTASTTGALDEPEILNDRWELRPELKARWGSKAPYMTKLRVLGAFLDVRHNELIPSDKRFRAKEIHDFGWS